LAKQLDKAGGEIYIKVGILTLINKFGQVIATYNLNPNLHELGIIVTTNHHEFSIPVTKYLKRAYLWHLNLATSIERD
jgi:hypothetical protein